MQRQKQLASQFIFDDSGQDLIEYALLTAIIGVAGALVFVSMRNNMSGWYSAWSADAQTNWEPSAPAGS